MDIIVPVYNEANNIITFLLSLKSNIQKISYRVLICYDFEEDTTLLAIQKNKILLEGISIDFVRNRGRGPHSAILSGFKVATADAILVMPADDFQNASIIDIMAEKLYRGIDIVCASRLMPGGTMQRCPFLKNILVRFASYTLYHLARIPTHDATNGFRMFSRTLLNQITIESCVGFTYSIEILVKAHRLTKSIIEIPAHWIERTEGNSRFQIFKWFIPYLRWYFYAFATTYGCRLMSIYKTVIK